MKKSTKTINEKVFDLLEETNTNWSVIKEPLITKTNKKTESFGIFRNDNNAWLGTVGNQYSVIQNSSLAETIITAANRLELDEFRGGILKEGRKIYYQVKLKDAQVGSDTIKRHITALNSHDGSTSIAFGSSNTVVICQNTFYRAYKELEKFRHTTNAEQRINIAMEALSSVIKGDVQLIESFNKMTEIKIPKLLFGNLIDKLFKVDLEVKTNEVSGQKQNQLIKFNEAVELETSRHGGKTLWSLFNAVTYYTNHIETVDKNGEFKKDPLHNVMIGRGSRKNTLAFDMIMKYVTENTLEPVLITKK